MDSLLNEGGDPGSDDGADQDDALAVVDSPMDVSDDTGVDLDDSSEWPTVPKQATKRSRNKKKGICAAKQKSRRGGPSGRHQYLLRSGDDETLRQLMQNRKDRAEALNAEIKKENSRASGDTRALTYREIE
ncbi:unnamed protein product, partial [Ectocarpus sp. 12 AP-2014]